MLSLCLPAKGQTTGVRKATAGRLAVPRLTIALTLLSLSVPLSSSELRPVTGAQQGIQIEYGRVAQHYKTSWSDPALPAGVTRGAPPPIDTAPIVISMNDDNVSGSRRIQESKGNPDFADPAILYVVDLGDRGMEMILSVKTKIRPGKCIAIERSEDYTNLRTVNAGYCDIANHEIITHLRSVDEASARRCMMARQSQHIDAPEAYRALTPAQLAMLCDGS